MEFNYYYGAEAEQFSFIRIPKVMLTEEHFSPLSLASKILYGVLLDRMSLSVKNKWLDEEQRVYIIFKIEEIQELLGFSKKKAIEYLGELEAFGLVEKKRRGLGLPSILYIKSFMVPGATKETEDVTVPETVDESTSRGVEIDTSVQGEMEPIISQSTENVDRNGENEAENDEKTEKYQEFCVRGVDLGTSGGVQIALQEVPKRTLQEVPSLTPLKNNTNINITDMSNTESNLILSDDEIGLDETTAYAELIRENIDYDTLLERFPYERELVEGIYDMILEIVCGKSKYTTIASSVYPTELVRTKFLKLDYSHIQYVLDSLMSNTTKVRNIKKYLLAALFNAPSTISGYYLAEVNHDMPQFARAR